MKKSVGMKNYKGLSVNERLAVSGQLDSFGTAAKNRNREQMISMLRRLAISEPYAKRWVDTLLGDQKFFYY
jgi:hypothetical protein